MSSAPLFGELDAPRPHDGARERGSAARLALGGAAVAFFLAHAATQVRAETPHNLLWACHGADLCVGLGILLRCRPLTSAAVLMLWVGLPMWLMSVACGGEFYPTSVLTHVGGLIVGMWAARRDGLWKPAWLLALALVAALLIVARCGTSPADNINLAFALWLWPNPWPQLPEAYLLILLGLWAALLRAAQELVARAS